MTRRLLTDPLLWITLLVQAAVQWVVVLPGDTVETVGQTVRHYNTHPLIEQLAQRLLVAVLIALPVTVLPALARRSRQRWRGRPSQRGRLAVLWDAPWHRDPIPWIAGSLATFPLLVLSGLSGEGTDSSGPDQVSRSTQTTTGTYLDVFRELPTYLLVFLTIAVALGLARLLFRLLGGQRPWQH